jgi:alkylation response protein AidB-like acyl-CoA dehydrogenase
VNDEQFRAEVRGWLTAQLGSAEFGCLVGKSGSGRQHEFVAERMAWERRLGEDGWIGLGWPEEDGGRGLPWHRQVIFHEEYARADAPGRVGHIGEQLVAPTLLMFGTPEQKARFLPGIAAGTELWCQGYSEPGAGSDLAGLSTRASLRDGEWHIDGQKIWTSLAHVADWCFLLARTEPLERTGPGAGRHRGLSCLLVPVRQPGIKIRPIMQITGTAEFNEVFFDDARTAAGNVAGEPGDGWRVALGMLGVERGVSNFGQLIGFQREFEAVLATARGNGSIADPDIAARIADAWIGLQVMRFTAEDTLAVPDPGAAAGGVATGGVATGGVATGGVAANIAKLLWAPWHQRLGELAADVTGADATLAGPGYDLTDAQRLFLFTRAETIFGGSNEIQRNIVAERGLGLPRG